MQDPRVLLYYIVEAALIGYVGLALIGVRIGFKQLMTIGLGQGLFVYLIRGIFAIYKIPIGLHIPVTLFGVIIILYLVARRGWGVSIIAGLLGLLILSLSEILMLPTLYGYLKITTEKIWADVWSHVIMGYIGDWLLILVAILLFASQKSPFNLQKLRK